MTHKGFNAVDMYLTKTAQTVYRILVEASIAFQDSVLNILDNYGFVVNDYASISEEGYAVAHNGTELIVVNRHSESEKDFLMLSKLSFSKMYAKELLALFEFEKNIAVIHGLGSTLSSELIPYIPKGNKDFT